MITNAPFIGGARKVAIDAVRDDLVTAIKASLIAA